MPIICIQMYSSRLHVLLIVSRHLCLILLQRVKSYLFFLDGNVLQEKVQSIMYLRNSSSGGKSVDSPALAVTCPTGFSAACQDGESCPCMLSKGSNGLIIGL